MVASSEHIGGKCYRPCDDDEHVESVPRFVEVRTLADQAHRHHLDTHLGGEEGEDEVVEADQDATADRRADLVDARLVHAERQTVEQDHAHTDPLEPRYHAPASRNNSRTFSRFIYLFNKSRLKQYSGTC